MFAAAESDIEETLKYVEKLTTRPQQHSRDTAASFPTLSLTPRAFDDTAHLPCFILPLGRTSRFFDRDDVIESINRHFQDGKTGTLRSLALYGMGGVGKSHVALKFVESRKSYGELDAIFWVQAEKPVDIQNSFTDIALRLKLADARPLAYDENRFIVMTWLQSTSALSLLQPPRQAGLVDIVV